MFVRDLGGRDTDSFELSNLEFRTLAQYSYLDSGAMKHLYMYHHYTYVYVPAYMLYMYMYKVVIFLLIFSGNKQIYGLFFPMWRKCVVYVVDTVRTDQMPNLNAMYNAERNNK